ncbi:MAG TPA: aromatic ring-hydroxylating dioxygenase subunit alpha [Candidatus Limnocylindrales bacterium]|nr:aromatic ring-hydroxylating dioxygenase subunit alpha [Candidatus Limnocylindrales bacterium]
MKEDRAARTSPVGAADVAATRQRVERASLLPPRVFHDPAVFEYEQAAWFGTSWLYVGRDEDARETGEYFLASVAGESLAIVRGEDQLLRAFYNVCRHRGARVVEGEKGRLARFQCPYHAWTYGLDGTLRRARHTDPLEDFEPLENSLVPARLESWQGFVFISLDDAAPTLAAVLGDFQRRLDRWELTALRRVRRIDYDVAANWKVIADNYSECYHCPGVHPQLNRLTPYDVGGNFRSEGPWAGGWMVLTDRFETMSMDGSAAGRGHIGGWSDEDGRRIYYFVVWPNILVSVFPDYLMTHQVWPIEPGRSVVRCEWFFAPEEIGRPGFDPSGPIEFWDLTNRQDWHVCESVQQGTSSRAYRAGRYTYMEDMVHAFDLMVADRYAADGVITRFPPRDDKWRAGRPLAGSAGAAAARADRLEA